RRDELGALHPRTKRDQQEHRGERVEHEHGGPTVRLRAGSVDVENPACASPSVSILASPKLGNCIRAARAASQALSCKIHTSMPTYWTVKEVGGAPVEVQSDLAGLQADLTDPLVAVYVYVGGKQDPGWNIAKTACALFAMTNPWRVDDIAALRPWVPAGAPKGVVFGYDGQPDNLLDDGEVTVLKIVRKALVDAI
ncbi:MAG TPA: hypothetical protein VK477_02570, partial [Acidobacteriota bacterium]|nr:hypothetical protein [Acidobacteriota bacterium]